MEPFAASRQLSEVTHVPAAQGIGPGISAFSLPYSGARCAVQKGQSRTDITPNPKTRKPEHTKPETAPWRTKTAACKLLVTTFKQSQESVPLLSSLESQSTNRTSLAHKAFAVRAANSSAYGTPTLVKAPAANLTYSDRGGTPPLFSPVAV